MHPQRPIVLDPETLTETDREILTLLTDGRVTAPYVATELDASQEYVRSRLRRLVEHGHAHKVHRGLYELDNDPRHPEPESESELESDAAGSDVRPRTGAVRHDPTSPGELDHAASHDNSDPFASVEFPAGRDRGECLAAIDAAVEFLETHGSASKSELVVNVMPDHALDYDVDAAVEKAEASGERFRGAWWRRIVKPGLEATPGVEKPAAGGSEWRYTGDS